MRDSLSFGLGRVSFLVVFLLLGTLFEIGAEAVPTAESRYARKVFQRITGVPLFEDDPRHAEMEKLVKAGKLLEAAHIATDDSGFYSITIRDWAATLSNREETPMVEFNDFQALMIGVTRDEIDARQLLQGGFRYEGKAQLKLPPVSVANNQHYRQFEIQRLDPKQDLVQRSPQWDGIADTAGLLTTRAWAKAHLAAGTNRRATEFTFREFLCSPIAQWKDTGLPDLRVRRDIDRKPGGEISTYQTMCRSCHAPMDGLAGAFAQFDFVNEAIVHFGPFGVAPKMNQNNNVFPPGYVTGDTSWINLATKNHNESFGWRGPIEGMGLREFGAMVANSTGFSSCMVQHAYRRICRKPMARPLRKSVLPSLMNQFEAGGYKLRALFERVAIEPSCLGTP